MLLERDEMDHTHTHTHATTGVGDEEAMVVVDVKQNPLFFFTWYRVCSWECPECR